MTKFKTNKNRRAFALLLAVLLVILYLPINSYAATTVYRWDPSNNTAGHGVKLEVNQSFGTQVFKVREYDSGNLIGPDILAYCIDTDTYIHSNKNYEKAFLENVNYFSVANASHIRAIIYGSYPKNNLAYLKTAISESNLTTEEAISGTQMAIWHFANGAVPKASEYDSGATSSNKRIIKLYNYLVGLPGMAAPALASVVTTGPTLAIVGNNVEIEFSFTTNGVNNQNGSPVVLSYTTNLVGFTETITTVGNVKHVKLVKDKSLIAAPYTFNLNISGLQTLTDAFIFTPVNGRSESQTLVSSGFQSETNISKELNGNLKDLLGKIVVTKSFNDQNDSEVSFELSLDDDVIGTYTTVGQVLTIDNLLPGNYSLVEVTPLGYTSSIEGFLGVIVVGGGTTPVVVTNTLITTEPPTTQPETTQPPTTQPETTQPETTQPPTTQPETTQPETTQPETTQPPTTQPETTQPPTTEPPTNPPTNPPTTEPVTEVITEVIVPQGPVVINFDEILPEVEPIEEEIVLEEDIPLAEALPQTGQLPIGFFVGLGMSITSVGVFLRKK